MISPNLSDLRCDFRYLSGNAITVVEGLTGLTNLTELHIANQRLPEGEKLLFDPRSLQAIAVSWLMVHVHNYDIPMYMYMTLYRCA